jgi:hypothetical protein
VSACVCICCRITKKKEFSFEALTKGEHRKNSVALFLCPENVSSMSTQLAQANEANFYRHQKRDEEKSYNYFVTPHLF